MTGRPISLLSYLPGSVTVDVKKAGRQRDAEQNICTVVSTVARVTGGAATVNLRSNVLKVWTTSWLSPGPTSRQGAFPVTPVSFTVHHRGPTTMRKKTPELWAHVGTPILPRDRTDMSGYFAAQL